MTTMLYAHWEGYCKTLFEEYIRLVLKRKPLLADSADGLVVAHTQHLLRRIESGDKQANLELAELARGGSTQRLRVNRDKVVDTKSNLRYVVLESIMTTLNLPLQDLALKRNMIDRQLCDSRNEVAHGRASFPSASETLTLHQMVIEMMEEMRDTAIGQIRCRGYSISGVVAR
ncbi:MAE_28990/MAE_18760 family HEPN-like nuclease [Tsukamurella sputi]